MRILIKSEQVVEDTNSKTGDVYRQQWGYLDVDGIQKPFKIGLGRTAKPHPIGEYELAAKSFQIDLYDKLKLGYVTLLPVGQKKA